MTTTLANPDNATYYQDTAFEEIPHIRHGMRIDKDHPAYWDLLVNPPINNVALAELGQGWHGLLIEFNEDDIAEYRENDVITDPQVTGAVVWKIDDELAAVHLLTADEHRQILQDTLSTILDRVIEHYDVEERLNATAPDDPLRDLIDLARRRRPQRVHGSRRTWCLGDPSES